MKEVDISCELWREYVTIEGKVYGISRPMTLMLKEGSESHRVLDIEGTTHYIPLSLFPIIRWHGDTVY